MLDFAMKVCNQSYAIDEQDFHLAPARFGRRRRLGHWQASGVLAPRTAWPAPSVCANPEFYAMGALKPLACSPPTQGRSTSAPAGGVKRKKIRGQAGVELQAAFETDARLLAKAVGESPGRPLALGKAHLHAFERAALGLGAWPAPITAGRRARGRFPAEFGAARPGRAPRVAARRAWRPGLLLCALGDLVQVCGPYSHSVVPSATMVCANGLRYTVEAPRR